MKKTMVTMMLTLGLIAMLSGCGQGKKEMSRAAFLSDYSKLKPESDTSLRYIDKKSLATYSSFIVDKVEVHFQEGAEAIETKFRGKLTETDIADLTSYFDAELVKAVGDAGYTVVFQPGPGVARMRTAITDIKETNVVLAAVPQARLISGAGVGGASVEFEIVDSKTNRQIAAVLERKAGSRVPFTGLTEWGGAKAAVNNWVKRMKKRLEEARK
jgi:hypothetical protein